MDEPLDCKECKKSYSCRSNLKAHLRRFHPDKVDALWIPKRASSSNEQPTNLFRCPLCEHNTSKYQLISHIESSHDIIIEKETLKFESVNDFETWKEDIERTTKSSYIKVRGTYIGASFNTAKFECHRSGIYKTKSKGEKNLKHQGSNKINAHCPAAMKLTQKGPEGTCEIEFIKTHVGHENNLENLFLSKTDREIIAAKLAAGIPMETILGEARDNVGSGNVERLNLLTRKDLYNIKQQARKLNFTSIRDECDMDGFEQLTSSTAKSLVDETYHQKHSLILAKRHVHNMLLHLRNLVETCESLAEVDVFKNALLSIEPALKAFKHIEKECVQVNIEGEKIVSKKYFPTSNKSFSASTKRKKLTSTEMNRNAIQLMNSSIPDGKRDSAVKVIFTAKSYNDFGG